MAAQPGRGLAPAMKTVNSTKSSALMTVPAAPEQLRPAGVADVAPQVFTYRRPAGQRRQVPLQADCLQPHHCRARARRQPEAAPAACGEIAKINRMFLSIDKPAPSRPGHASIASHRQLLDSTRSAISIQVCQQAGTCLPLHYRCFPLYDRFDNLSTVMANCCTACHRGIVGRSGMPAMAAFERLLQQCELCSKRDTV